MNIQIRSFWNLIQVDQNDRIFGSYKWNLTYKLALGLVCQLLNHVFKVQFLFISPLCLMQVQLLLKPGSTSWSQDGCVNILGECVSLGTSMEIEGIVSKSVLLRRGRTCPLIWSA